VKIHLDQNWSSYTSRLTRIHILLLRYSLLKRLLKMI